MKIVTAEKYKQALQDIDITDKQMAMLKAHFEALNRSITYTELANSAEYDDYSVANIQYGKLGRALGEAVEFEFKDSTTNDDRKFYGSSIGMENSYTDGDFQLVMHHELAKAIEQLNLFDS